MVQDKMIVIHILNDILEAILAKDKLKAMMIDSFLENKNPISLIPLGGTDLKIFSKDKEKRGKNRA